MFIFILSLIKRESLNRMYVKLNQNYETYQKKNIEYKIYNKKYFLKNVGVLCSQTDNFVFNILFKKENQKLPTNVFYSFQLKRNTLTIK